MHNLIRDVGLLVFSKNIRKKGKYISYPQYEPSTIMDLPFELSQINMPLYINDGHSLNGIQSYSLIKAKLRDVRKAPHPFPSQ